MPATPDDLFEELRRLGIAYSTIEHPAVFTVAESQSLRARIEGGKSKNLFLKDKKGRLFLFVAEDEAEIDLKRLHETLGGSGRLSFASADQLREILGVEPGSVTPFGVINDVEGRVTVALDVGLMAHGEVNFHPLVNTATTKISAEGLIAFLRSTGHEPLIVMREG
jgi:Ala-tRNA(Pro) deacylase